MPQVTAMPKIELPELDTTLEEKIEAEMILFHRTRRQYPRRQELQEEILTRERQLLAALYELSELRKASEWVSVKDSLPTSKFPVLICHLFEADGVLGRDANGQHVWYAAYDHGWKRADGLTVDEVFHGNITHWKSFLDTPLPASAVEEKKA